MSANTKNMKTETLYDPVESRDAPTINETTESPEFIADVVNTKAVPRKLSSTTYAIEARSTDEKVEYGSPRIIIAKYGVLDNYSKLACQKERKVHKRVSNMTRYPNRSTNAPRKGEHDADMKNGMLIIVPASSFEYPYTS